VEHLDPTKAHTVYQVEVTTHTGSYFRVERRYSAFHSLNKECKRQYQGPGHRLAEFPPKRIRNTSAKVLESRRTGLEHYLQSLARLSPPPAALAAFLALPAALEAGETSSTAVIGFTSDPALTSGHRGEDLDMITQATLATFYSGF